MDHTLPPQTIKGACLCEGTKFTVTGSPEKVFACYCTDCSKGAGGPYQIVYYQLQLTFTRWQPLPDGKIPDGLD